MSEQTVFPPGGSDWPVEGAFRTAWLRPGMPGKVPDVSTDCGCVATASTR